uniref:Zinc finger and SCAN domain containing 5B n=1 Tax=Loxodonta africana TaxID=9785 RepID=G3TLL9_LOXAF
MAANLTSSWCHGKPCDNPGSEPPQFVSSQGTDVGEKGCNPETWHVNFRAFTCSEEADCIGDLKRLCELCHLWLRPDLHTKEQILDKLVLEQFMISMPLDLQVLVKESGVENCKDLEEMQRNNKRPKTWSKSIVCLQGQEFLLQNPGVQMAEMEPHYCVSEINLEDRRKTNQEHQSFPRIDETLRIYQLIQYLKAVVSHQGEGYVIHQIGLSISGNRNFCQRPFLQIVSLRPEQNLEKNLMEDKEESTVCDAQKPQLLKGPADSVGAGDGKNPKECTSVKNVDADTPPTLVLERAVSNLGGNREDSQKESSKRRKPGNSVNSQAGSHKEATHLNKREFLAQIGLQHVDSLRTMGPNDHDSPNQEPTGHLPYPCGFCKKRFHSTLHGHKRICTNEKPFHCTKCGECFSYKGNLNIHQRIHAGPKSYTCPKCGHTFHQ